MKKKVIITSIVLGVLILLGGAGFGIASYQKKLNKDLVNKRADAENLDELKIGFNGMNAAYYPESAIEINTYAFNDHVYDGLVTFDNELRVVPMIAQSWENPDINTWRFRLRKDVTFHNGAKLTADDVVASLELAVANEEASQMIPTVESIKKVDDYTVDIITNVPTPILANSLTYIFILPKTLIDAKDFKNPIGSGEYKYISGTETEWTLERFDGYYGKKPKPKKVTLKIFENEEDRFEALKKGEIDIMEKTEPHTGDMTTNAGKQIITVNAGSLEVSFIAIDYINDQNPNIKGVTSNPLKDARVRRAMRLSLDVPKLITNADVLYAEPASQMVTSSVFGYNPNIKPTEYNLVEAKKLMKEAGYENGFTLVYDALVTREKIATEIKNQFLAIGINAELNLLEPAVESFRYLTSGKSAMSSLSWVSQTGDALDGYNTIFGKEHGLFAYDNAEFSDLLDKTINTFDQNKRKEYMQKMAAIIDAENPVIVTYSLTTAQAYQEDINYISKADGTIQAKNASGAIPDNLIKDYSFWDALKNIFGFER